jgi:predicted component of type VI protein secretion system
MVVRFHVVSPVEKKRTFTVRLPILLGRGEEAKFRIQHDLVSRKHCELFERHGWVYVRDLGSTNGTFLNDEQVPVSTKTVVSPGGIVRVGGLSFAVDYQSPVAVDATTALAPSGHLEGSGVEESRVGGADESLPEEQPDFQVVHEDEESPAAPAAVATSEPAAVAAPEPAAVAAPEPAGVGELGSADVAPADARADADEVRPPEPTSPPKQPEGFDFLSAEASTESSADAPQWPAAGAAAADVSDDDQLNSFFKGLK